MSERARQPRIVVGGDTEVRPYFGAGSHGAPFDPLAEAAERGRAEGREEGRREAEAALAVETEAMRRELSRALSGIASLEASLTCRHEALLAEIALEAASRIVRERIEAGDPVAVRAVREAMASLPPSARLEARVSPADVEALSADLAAEIERGRVHLSPDQGVERGGCVLESPVGTVDATLEAARDAVRGAVLGGAVAP